MFDKIDSDGYSISEELEKIHKNQRDEDDLEVYYGLIDIGENLIREGFLNKGLNIIYKALDKTNNPKVKLQCIKVAKSLIKDGYTISANEITNKLLK